MGFPLLASECLDSHQLAPPVVKVSPGQRDGRAGVHSERQSALQICPLHPLLRDLKQRAQPVQNVNAETLRQYVDEASGLTRFVVFIFKLHMRTLVCASFYFYQTMHL